MKPVYTEMHLQIFNTNRIFDRPLNGFVNSREIFLNVFAEIYKFTRNNKGNWHIWSNYHESEKKQIVCDETKNTKLNEKENKQTLI